MDIDWATRIVSVPQADLTPVGGDVYDLNTNTFRLATKVLEASETGIVFPDITRHNTTVLLGGIQYARTIEIINGYSVTFEDLSYIVNIVGSNNNILDSTNLNLVQLRSNNSAGLINVNEIQYDIFGGGVHLDQTNGVAGQLYPMGTPLSPVNNVTDAIAIANAYGFDTIHVEGGSLVFEDTDVLDGFILQGTSADKEVVAVPPLASITNCIFRNVTLMGSLDGGNSASFCIIAGLDYVDGSLLDCLLAEGDIVIRGTQANFLRCASAVAGGGPGQTVFIDIDNQDTDIVVRDYHGGITFKNNNFGDGDVSIDMSSGRVIFDSTITEGTYTVRGIADVEHTQTGNEVIQDKTINKSLNSSCNTIFLN